MKAKNECKNSYPLEFTCLYLSKIVLVSFIVTFPSRQTRTSEKLNKKSVIEMITIELIITDYDQNRKIFIFTSIMLHRECIVSFGHEGSTPSQLTLLSFPNSTEGKEKTTHLNLAAT